MGRGRPRGRTAQGEATKQRLYGAALKLFAERGYEATTLRAIASEAGVSPGLLYTYFPSKAAVVVALYGALSRDFVHRCESLQAGGWFARAHATLRLSLASLADHREVLRAVIAVMLTDPELGLFSPSGAEGRALVRGRFLVAVAEADDAPSGLAPVLGRLIDLAHLGVILWWLLDRSDDTAATDGLVAWLGTLGGVARLALWLPGMAQALTTLDRLATAALYGDAPAPAPGRH